jgi:hypothetical protein
MTVQERINADMKSAMKKKETTKRDLLRVVMAEFSRVGKEVSDEKALAIIKKMGQNATDQNKFDELHILASYLPDEMDELELKRVCMNFIMNMNSPTMRDMGKVMGYLKNNYNGLYDGKLASTLVKELLM